MRRKICSVILVLLGFGVIAILPALSDVRSIWVDLVSVDSPRILQTFDYHPVEIVVSFKDGALSETFKASLNGKDITKYFTNIPGGKHAFITPDEGLKCYIIGQNSAMSMINFLTTSIQGNGNKRDTDVRAFNVMYKPVKTARDDKGVWFITGGSLGDVMEAMGYAVATDRLWQMELYRRSAKGMLAEIFGPGGDDDYIKTDTLARTIGYTNQELSDGFAALDRETQIVIESYVKGINKRIAQINASPYHSLMPFEFLYTGCPLNNWSKEDILAWMALLLKEFDCEALEQGQINNLKLFLQLRAQYGENQAFVMFNDLRWLNDANALTYIPEGPSMSLKALSVPRTEARTPEINAAPEDLDLPFDAFKKNLEKINARVKMGSYAWAVSGKKTADGKPIIYSGPQMGFSVPAIVLEGSIRGGGLNISGMSVPGIPGIIIGRTPHHAWSMQVGHARTVDYYMEADSNIISMRDETINIAGDDPKVIQVYRTIHGPIVYPNPMLSWKYSHWGYEFKTIKAFLNLARAKSMDDFGKAIEDVAVSQHFCYVDKDKNIAYWMSGRDPVRPVGEWRLPQGFLDTPLEWDASVLIPRSTNRNSPQGYYCGWNNKSSPSYNDSINSDSYFFGPFHRAHVVNDYLSANNKLTFEEVRDLALNIATTDSFGGGGIPWEFVMDDFTYAVNHAADDPIMTPKRKGALKLLSKWDGHFVDGGPSEWSQGVDRSDAWILQDAWVREVIRLTFSSTLPGYYDPENDTVMNRLFNVYLHARAGNFNLYDWFQGEDPNGIIVDALDNVLAILDLDNRPWGTGQRGVIELSYAFLGGWVDSIPYATRSTYAHCVEFGYNGPIRIESMFPLGESGNILFDGTKPVPDSNFDSMCPVFDPFEPRPFPLFNY